jgi:hypothetical protein
VLAALDTITPSKKWWGARRTIATEYRLCLLAAQHVSFGLVLRHYMSITLMGRTIAEISGWPRIDRLLHESERYGISCSAISMMNDS